MYLRINFVEYEMDWERYCVFQLFSVVTAIRLCGW
jgi:hypothetical protein